jgi:hypothetical protein
MTGNHCAIIRRAKRAARAIPRMDINMEREDGTVSEPSAVLLGIVFHAIRPPRTQKMRPAAEEM